MLLCHRTQRGVKGIRVGIDALADWISFLAGATLAIFLLIAAAAT